MLKILIMKLDVFHIHQASIEKYAEIEVVRDQIIWMNTNIDKDIVRKVGTETGSCDETIELHPVLPSIAEQYAGKVSHQIEISLLRKKNLFLNLNKEQLNEIYPPEPPIIKHKKKPRLLKILGFMLTGIAILSSVLSL